MTAAGGMARAGEASPSMVHDLAASDGPPGCSAATMSGRCVLPAPPALVNKAVVRAVRAAHGERDNAEVLTLKGVSIPMWQLFNVVTAAGGFAKVMALEVSLVLARAMLSKGGTGWSRVKGWSRVRAEQGV